MRGVENSVRGVENNGSEHVFPWRVAEAFITAQSLRMSTRGSKWQRYLSYTVTAVGIIVFLLIFFGRREMLGTKYKVSETESVNYSGAATEEDARKTGEALKEIGYFKGGRADVLLKKESAGFIVSFVVSRSADEKTLAAFQQIGGVLADKALGRPLTVRLLDTKLNKKNELKVE